MAGSAVLNPASLPFIPGGLRSSEDEVSIGLGFGHHVIREQTSSSSLSLSPSEHRSSPSPPRDDEHRDHGSGVGSGERNNNNNNSLLRFQPSPPALAEERTRSPPLRYVDANKSYPAIDMRAREPSSLGTLDTLPECDDPPPTDNPTAEHSVPTPGRGSPFFSPASSQGRERFGSPPVPINSSRSPFLHNYTHHNHHNTAGGPPLTSSSPVSSLESASQFALNLDPTSSPKSSSSHGFDAQLKSSPVIHEILDRIVHCEYTTREIQRDLGEVHRKLNLLLDRVLGGSGSHPHPHPHSHSHPHPHPHPHPPPLQQQQPEFKDPFAPPNLNNGVVNGPRGSLMGGNIAPNQFHPSDDITQISQRLNTLTNSVSQLLALQTQQHIQNTTSAALANHSMIGPLQHPGDPPNPTSMTPHPPPPPSTTPTGAPGVAALGHGLPSRPDLRPTPRVPNPPMRTWSVGNLDLPARPPPEPASVINRQESLLRDKRRSVTGLMRRDSSGILETPGDNWSGSSRDSGPMISKWDHMALAPELLRSLNKFGVGPPNKIQQRALPFLLRGADIIAQAPPTQERIAAYVIPAIQVAVTNTSGRPPNRGPIVIMVSTTVDQATQAQRMIRDLGGPIGIRSALGVGTTSANNDLTQELRLLHQSMPHIICGTPQKLHALFTAPSGLIGSEVRFLVIDEVDQLIARNLHEFVFNIVKLLPPPRSRSLPSNTPGPVTQPSFLDSPSSHSSMLPQFSNTGRRFSSVSPAPTPTDGSPATPPIVERQTALFSNTVPQDVLNLASAIQLREPVRVLVRRDGNVTHADIHQGSRALRQFYLYLAFTAGGRSDPLAATSGGGLGIIGSGRSASSAESAQAREWKLDALADLFDDVEVTQAIVHVGGMTALDHVVYKLASRGLEAVPLHGDMNAGTKLAALNKFRSSTSATIRQPVAKVLVVYDVQVKAPDVSHIPLIINYDLPKAVEEYSHRVAPALGSNYSRAGVVVNFVTATGGDVEMLRSIECYYKIKCPEVPLSLRDIV